MKTRLIINSLILVYLLLLLSCQSHHQPKGIKAQVQQVLSGQTLEVLIDDSNLRSKVRLIGIQAPDLQQKPWGITAKNILKEWLENKQIILELGTPEEDIFKRKLAYVWYQGELINEKLIAQGYVLDAPEYDNNKYNKSCQRAREYARLMGSGIWNNKQPMRQTPAEFRSQNE